MPKRGMQDLKPCRRCGCNTWWNRKAKVPGICRDCRQADPEYVRALTRGVTLVPRESDAPWGTLIGASS